MVRDGTMNLQNGTWADIKIRRRKMINRKYIVMSKFDHSDRFNMEKGFSTIKDANSYAKLMMDNNDYDGLEYFCFEQTVDYSYLFNNSEDKEEKKWWE
jgi:hypothetical protein